MAETDAEPAREWRCFHCDELFTDFDAAADHFGKYERDCEPICTVGAKRFREMEDELAMWRNESDSSSRAFYELGAKHTQELMRNEERGYERGLRDARHEEIWRWYLAAPTVERLKRALAWSIATVETVALQLPVGSTKRVMLQRENQRAREIAGIARCGARRTQLDPMADRIMSAADWRRRPIDHHTCSRCLKAQGYWLARADSGDLPP